MPGNVAECGDPKTQSAVQYNCPNPSVMSQSARGGEGGRFGGIFAANLIDQCRQRESATGRTFESQAGKKPVVSEHAGFLRMAG